MTLKFYLAKIIGMSDEQVLEHFKEAFLTKFEPPLVEVNYIDIETGAARVLILLFKSELIQSVSSSMLANMTDGNETPSHKE